MRVIGGGGFASVWRARSSGPGGFERPVAIKVMRPARAKLKRFQDMLLDEARLVARIEHPNVAQIWEVGEDPRSIYVVMELVDGAALDVLRDRAEELGRPLPLGAVFRVLADVCGGLHAAHELTSDAGEPLALVHRDVSPQNILVSRRGTAKLIDFGIAKAKERLGADTKSGFIKGKISFMAPEQARAEEVDRRADVWAVGAVAYDLLAGHPPVEAPSDLARLAQLGGPEPVPPLDEEVPAPLRAVVARALAKEREARFPTALAMKAAIEEALIESEHETTADEAGRLLAPFFPGAAPTATATATAERPDAAVPDEPEGPPGASVEKAVSSTIDARLVDGSIEIPVHRARWWPLAAGAALAGGLAWWSLAPSTDPAARRATDATSRATAGAAARSAPALPGPPASASPRGTGSPGPTGAAPARTPIGAPAEGSRPAAASSVPASSSGAGSATAPPRAAPTPAPPPQRPATTAAPRPPGATASAPRPTGAAAPAPPASRPATSPPAAPPPPPVDDHAIE